MSPFLLETDQYFAQPELMAYVRSERIMPMPMPRELTFRTTVSLSIWDGDETELDLVIKYEINRGQPETGAGYLADPANYDPGSADEVYIRSILLISNSQAVAVPLWLDRLIRQDNALAASMISEAAEREAA